MPRHSDHVNRRAVSEGGFRDGCLRPPPLRVRSVPQSGRQCRSKIASQPAAGLSMPSFPMSQYLPRLTRAPSALGNPRCRGSQARSRGTTALDPALGRDRRRVRRAVANLGTTRASRLSMKHYRRLSALMHIQFSVSPRPLMYDDSSAAARRHPRTTPCGSQTVITVMCASLEGLESVAT